MIYEKRLTIEREGVREDVLYYVRKRYSAEFDCIMYNVGIETGKQKNEIEDFSPCSDEAVRLCEELYSENVSLKNLFLIGEEFLVKD